MKNLRTICYEIKAYLNTALCQSPPNISKTQKAMEYIKHFALLSRFVNNSEEQGVHHISVILTNNNLSETKQWKIRLQKCLRGLNVMVLSSKKTSDIKNLDQLWGKLTRTKKADQMPDLIVMCSHDKRASDLVELLKTLKSTRYNFTDIGIHHITMTIMFDEADKNVELISSCLNEINPLLTNSSGKQKIDNVLRDIHFITATPLKTFWKKLKKCGIDKLSNINSALRSLDRNSPLHMNYEELMKNYRWLTEHNRTKCSNNITEDTMEYAMEIMNTIIDKKNGIKTVFAPSDMYIHSHNLMQKAFQKKGYWVYVDNSESKGFFDYDGIYTSLDDFNIKYNIQGELYNSLVKWRELYPDQNIAITGYLNIVRGITFNTTGFNFTDAILSAYHMKNVAELIQLFGRANGGKEYVQVMNIYCPDCVWKCADDQIQIMAELHNKNPAEFEEKDFRPVTKKDLMEKAWTVPSVFPIRPDAWKNIRKIGNGKKWDKDSIFREIEKCAGGEEIVKEIRNRDCFQCTQPEKEDTYKKYVTDFIKKSCEKEKYNMGLHKPDKVKDGYQIFLDNKGHNIIVSIYNGSLIPRQAFEEENEETPNNTPTEENSEV